MRVRSEWTPGGIVLWLIAAIVATFVVCTQTEKTEPPATAPDPPVDFELLE